MIIGAMKCGTTTLYWHLSQHPKICPCITKEPEFFSEHQSHGISVEKYSDLWDFDPDQHKYVLEASTGYAKYLFENNVAKRIKEYGLLPTFIYIVRDPFSRIESDYNFSIAEKWFNPRTPITDDKYINFSKYFMQLEPYREHFGPENILVLDFDELVTNPKNLLSFLFNRLKLENHNFEFNNVVKNKTIMKKSQAEVFVNSSPLIRSAVNLFPLQVRRLIGKLPIKPFSTPAQKRKLTKDERAVIHEKLKHDIRLFHQHYGFPVQKWGF